MFRRYKSVQSFKALDELDVGVCHGMTYEETEAKFPEFFAERERNKYFTRCA